MGSPLRLTLPGACERRADDAWTITRRMFDETERDLTRFDRNSPLSRLNRATGSTVHVAPGLARALSAAWRAFRFTNGRFDPRIIGALEDAGERSGVELPPSPARLDPRACWLWLDHRRLAARVTAPVDLGGIGKGLALRWTAHALEQAGHRDFLLQAGGDLVARGIGPAARPWIVAVEPPPGAATAPFIVELRNEAVATSSAAIRQWAAPDGRPRHHLIDPATGHPAETPWWSVTVRAADPAWAEVAAKVGFLAGDRIRTELAGSSWVAWAVGDPVNVPEEATRAMPT